MCARARTKLLLAVVHGVHAPRRFVQRLRAENEVFNNQMHQDAHEFLNYLLNEMAEILEKRNKRSIFRRKETPRGKMGSEEIFCRVCAITSCPNDLFSQRKMVNVGSTFTDAHVFFLPEDDFSEPPERSITQEDQLPPSDSRLLEEK